MSTTLKQRTLEIVQLDRLAQITPKPCGAKPNATLTVTFTNTHAPTLQFSASAKRLAYLPTVFTRSVQFHANATQFENAYKAAFDSLYIIEPDVAISDVGDSIRKLGNALPKELWKEFHRHSELIGPTKDSVAITIQRDGHKYLFPLTIAARMNTLP